MSRRLRHDVLVAGAGVVGAACALVLARRGLDVALVEGREPPPWRDDRADLRVYALATDNAALLDGAGLWRDARAAGAHPYRRMRVWDAAGGDELVFDADAFGRRELGWIVEHAWLVDRLWRALPQAGVDVRCPARVAGFSQDDEAAVLELDDSTRLQARIAIAADGGASTLRQLAGIDVDARDYGQRGVVAYVRSERPHEDTAWQRFLPTGPLAFLPCANGDCSIVWSLPDAEAERVLALDDAAFARELTHAFAARLGESRPVGKRVGFPLRRQLARRMLQGRLLVIGDAAHVVHPLAGQGVNLGLRDVGALLRSVDAAGTRGVEWMQPARLARWARTRRSENAMAAHAFEAINRLYSNDGLAGTLLRGHLLGLAGRMPPVAHALWKRAAGL